jgi:hypothetical protein
MSDMIHRKGYLFFHFLLDRLLLGHVIRVKDVHSFKIQRTYSPHESFLKVFLHHSFMLMLSLDYRIGLVQFLSQTVNLLIILSADVLEFEFHCTIEIFSILYDLPFFVLLFPAKEHLPLLV